MGCEKQSTQEELANRFRALVEANEILQIPGAHDRDGSSCCEKYRFSALYLSGAAYASKGLPDLGIVTSTEVVRARDLVRATDLPVLVDIDTGFGGVLNVARTAVEMVEAKVAAVQIEDQQLPKMWTFKW